MKFKVGKILNYFIIHFVLNIIIIFFLAVSDMNSNLDIFFSVVLTILLSLHCALVLTYSKYLKDLDYCLITNHYISQREVSNSKQVQADLKITKDKIKIYELAYLFQKYEIFIPYREFNFNLKFKFFYGKYAKISYFSLAITFFTLFIYFNFLNETYAESTTNLSYVAIIYLVSITITVLTSMKFLKFISKNAEVLSNDFSAYDYKMSIISLDYLNLFADCFFKDISCSDLEKRFKSMLYNNSILSFNFQNISEHTFENSIIVHCLNPEKKFKFSSLVKYVEDYPILEEKFNDYVEQKEDIHTLTYQTLNFDNCSFFNIYAYYYTHDWLFNKERMSEDIFKYCIKEAYEKAEMLNKPIVIESKFLLKLYKDSNIRLIHYLNYLMSDYNVKTIYKL